MQIYGNNQFLILSVSVSVILFQSLAGRYNEKVEETCVAICYLKSQKTHLRSNWESSLSLLNMRVSVHKVFGKPIDLIYIVALAFLCPKYSM